MSSSELGYIIDFLAGFFIIQSIILRSKRHIKIESSTLWDGNPLLYEAQLKAFWDGWIGVALLLIGLIFHLIHIELDTLFSIISISLSIGIPSTFRFLIRYKIEKDVRKEYSFYDEVKKRAKSGEDN
jgi:hypothetical protein